MESGSSVVGKPHKKQKANEVDDIISNKLPESLISRILSFLPTKDAVRTGVLSKRWIYRWTTITKLDLNDSVFYSPKRKTGGKQHFVNFVNRALLLTSVESFSLVIANHKYDESLLNTWISSILNRRVRNLRIVSNSELIFSAFTLHSLLKSWYLEELVLHMCCGIKVPAHHVCFGHLKLLKLCGIIFAIVSSSYDSYQSLNLPVLKRFETKNCLWLSKKSVTVTVEAPLLESVFIEQDLESVSHELHSCAITFSALHLKEFTYSGYGVSGSITLSKPSSAHNASANIVLKQSGDIVPETGSCAFNLLKQFSQAKCIKFDGSKGASSRGRIGGFLMEEDGSWIAGFTSDIGISTNLHVELMAILFGLSFTWERGIKYVICYSDSQNAINLITGVALPFQKYAPVIVDIREMQKNWMVHL